MHCGLVVFVLCVQACAFLSLLVPLVACGFVLVLDDKEIRSMQSTSPSHEEARASVMEVHARDICSLWFCTCVG